MQQRFIPLVCLALQIHALISNRAFMLIPPSSCLSSCQHLSHVSGFSLPFLFPSPRVPRLIRAKVYYRYLLFSKACFLELQISQERDRILFKTQAYVFLWRATGASFLQRDLIRVVIRTLKGTVMLEQVWILNSSEVKSQPTAYKHTDIPEWKTYMCVMVRCPHCLRAGMRRHHVSLSISTDSQNSYISTMYKKKQHWCILKLTSKSIKLSEMPYTASLYVEIIMHMLFSYITHCLTHFAA